MEKRLLTKREFAQVMGLGSTKVHEMVITGQIKSIKIGRAVRIPVEEVDALIGGPLI